MYSSIARLFSANLIVQLIPFVASPFLAKIYSIGVFGLFATVVSISSLITCFATGKLEKAVIIASSDVASKVLAQSASIIVFIVSFFCLVSLLLLNLFYNIYAEYWFLPLLVLSSGLLQVYMAFANRLKRYRRMIKARLAGACVRNSLMLIFGLVEPSAISILSGFALGVMLEFLLVIFPVISFDISFRRFRWSLKRYIRFIKITTTSSFVENIGSSGLPVLFNFALGEQAAGAIAMAQRLVAKPVGALSGAVSEVFKVSFQKDKKGYQSKKRFYRLFLLALCGIGIVPMVIGMLFGQEIVITILGESWRLAATYVEILIPIYFLSFAVGSVSSILFAFEKLMSELAIQLVISLSVLAIFVVFPLLAVPSELMLIFFLVIMASKYLAMLCAIEYTFMQKMKPNRCQ